MRGRGGKARTLAASVGFVFDVRLLSRAATRAILSASGVVGQRPLTAPTRDAEDREIVGMEKDLVGVGAPTCPEIFEQRQGIRPEDG